MSQSWCYSKALAKMCLPLRWRQPRCRGARQQPAAAVNRSWQQASGYLQLQLEPSYAAREPAAAM